MCGAPTLRFSGKDRRAVCAEGGKREEGLLIRAFREQDAAAVSDILQEAREAAGWSASMVREIFSSGRVSGYISETGGKATGFVLGREVLDEGEILNLAVTRKNRGQGEGTALLRKLLDSFAARGVWRIFLEVRESNLCAIAFYAKLGFQKVGRREGYYREPTEAALILEYGTKNPQFSTE